MFLPLKDNLRSANFPLVTAGLITINCLVFFLATSDAASSTDGAIRFGLIPYELTHSGIQCVPLHSLTDMYCGTPTQIHQIYPTVTLPSTLITVFSSMFLHAGLEHLLGNMLYLFVFGRALETALGRWMFLLVYLMCGVIALVGQTLWDINSTVPMVGASGAIAGLMGGYLLLFPGARVFSLFIIFPCRPRAFWVIGSWIILQLVMAWEMAGAGAQGGVAVFAHIAGFAGGAALTYFLIGSDRIPEFRRMARAADGPIAPPVPQPVLAGVPQYAPTAQPIFQPQAPQYQQHYQPQYQPQYQQHYQPQYAPVPMQQVPPDPFAPQQQAAAYGAPAQVPQRPPGC